MAGFTKLLFPDRAFRHPTASPLRVGFVHPPPGDDPHPGPLRDPPPTPPHAPPAAACARAAPPRHPARHAALTNNATIGHVNIVSAQDFPSVAVSDKVRSL